MGFIVILFGLWAMATANHQDSSPSHFLRRPFIVSPHSYPIQPPQGSKKDVIIQQNLYPSIGTTYPLSVVPLSMSESPLEDQPGDFGLLPTEIQNPFGSNPLQSYDSTQNSFGLYSSTGQNDQVPNLLYPEPNDEFSSLYGYQDIGISQLPRYVSSPYELNQQYNPIREGVDGAKPEWSTMEEKLQYAANVIRINMVDPELESVTPWWESRAEYTLILGVLLELMEEVEIHGSQSYENIFTETVLASLAKMRLTLTPNELARQLLEAVKIVDISSAYLRDHINKIVHSPICHIPLVCKVFIDKVLKITRNQRLRDEKKVLLAAVELADIFLKNYAEEFETAARKSMAYIYFGNLIRHRNIYKLKPLVLAGVALIKEVKELNPESN